MRCRTSDSDAVRSTTGSPNSSAARSGGRPGRTCRSSGRARPPGCGRTRPSPRRRAAGPSTGAADARSVGAPRCRPCSRTAAPAGSARSGRGTWVPGSGFGSTAVIRGPPARAPASRPRRPRAGRRRPTRGGPAGSRGRGPASWPAGPRPREDGDGDAEGRDEHVARTGDGDESDRVLADDAGEERHDQDDRARAAGQQRQRRTGHEHGDQQHAVGGGEQVLQPGESLPGDADGPLSAANGSWSTTRSRNPIESATAMLGNTTTMTFARRIPRWPWRARSSSGCGERRDDDVDEPHRVHERAQHQGEAGPEARLGVTPGEEPHHPDDREGEECDAEERAGRSARRTRRAGSRRGRW